jgi:hypothetical protein
MKIFWIGLIVIMLGFLGFYRKKKGRRNKPINKSMLTQKAIKFGVLGVVLAVTLVVGLVWAQATSANPLSCGFGSPAVFSGQPVLLTASGGSGSYSWYGKGLSLTGPTGAEVRVSYNATGTHKVVVISGNETSSCSLVVASKYSVAGEMD